MILQWVDDDDDNDHNYINNNINNNNSMYESLVQHIGTQSVWTVDLVIVLHELLSSTRKANFFFTTSNLTVNPDFSNLPYYKAAFQQDARRVQARIHAIRLQNLPAYQLLSDVVSIRAVMELIQRPDTVAILLVDNTVLRQSNNNKMNSKTEPSAAPYAGHYIILAGIVTSTAAATPANNRDDDNMDETTAAFDGCNFVVYNPALEGPGPVHIPIHHIEKAWRAKGTDQDIIFVTKR